LVIEWALKNEPAALPAPQASASPLIVNRQKRGKGSLNLQFHRIFAVVVHIGVKSPHLTRKLLEKPK
jgi:hypothetical protein